MVFLLRTQVVGGDATVPAPPWRNLTVLQEAGFGVKINITRPAIRVPFWFVTSPGSHLRDTDCQRDVHLFYLKNY